MDDDFNSVYLCFFWCHIFGVFAFSGLCAPILFVELILAYVSLFLLIVPYSRWREPNALHF